MCKHSSGGARGRDTRSYWWRMVSLARWSSEMSYGISCRPLSGRRVPPAGRCCEAGQASVRRQTIPSRPPRLPPRPGPGGGWAPRLRVTPGDRSEKLRANSAVQVMNSEVAEEPRPWIYRYNIRCVRVYWRFQEPGCWFAPGVITGIEPPTHRWWWVQTDALHLRIWETSVQGSSNVVGDPRIRLAESNPRDSEAWLTGLGRLG